MPVQVRPAVPEAASGDNRPFWAIFLCKENSPQGATPRLYSLPDELFPFFCGLYSPPSFHLVSSPKKEQHSQEHEEGAHDDSEHRITSLERCSSLVTKGYFRPLTSHKRKLGSIIQLIVRNVKRIFIRSYILQIAVLIAASGAFDDQIK